MLKIEDHRRPQPLSAPTGFALWNLGFRPFYLLASGFAALSILLWVGQYAGYLPAVHVRDPAWHGHEMLFGYTMAVIAGFLLTAVRNWTGKSTPAGASLIALAVLWVAGRVLILTPMRWPRQSSTPRFRSPSRSASASPSSPAGTGATTSSSR